MSGWKPQEELIADRLSAFLVPIFGSEGEGGEGGSEGGQAGGEGGAGGGSEENGEHQTDFSSITDPSARRIAELSDESAKARIKGNREKSERLKAEAANKTLQAEMEKLKKKGTKDEISDEARALIEGPLNEQISKRDQAMRNVLVNNALLAESVNDKLLRVWHDPATVISQIDFDEVTFDPESGTIEGIEDELNRIAKDKPFLVKSSKKAKQVQNGQKLDAEGNPMKNGASGRQPGGAGSVIPGGDPVRRGKLAEKYKLNRR